MKKVVAEKYRDIDFSHAKRGAVVTPGPGKTKISIRLDNAVLEYFRTLVDKAGGGNHQTLINEALLEYVHRRSTLDVVRQAVREELAPYGIGRRSNTALQRTRRAPRGRRAGRGPPGGGRWGEGRGGGGGGGPPRGSCWGEPKARRRARASP